MLCLSACGSSKRNKNQEKRYSIDDLIFLENFERIEIAYPLVYGFVKVITEEDEITDFYNYLKNEEEFGYYEIESNSPIVKDANIDMAINILFINDNEVVCSVSFHNNQSILFVGEKVYYDEDTSNADLYKRIMDIMKN